MTEREFIEFVVRAVKWAQRESDRQAIPYTDDPVNRDWRRLNNFGLFEDSSGNLGFALDWESDGKCEDAEVFIVSRRFPQLPLELTVKSAAAQLSPLSALARITEPSWKQDGSFVLLRHAPWAKKCSIAKAKPPNSA